MSFGFGFGFTKITAAIRAAFSPSSLFAANEPGVWYDPSDLSTLFQDAAGTTPVTTVEQPVGLMLDKSKGLVLGAPLGMAYEGWTKNPDESYTRNVVWKGMGATSADAGKTYLFEFTVGAITAGTSLSFYRRNATNTGNEVVSTVNIVAGGKYSARVSVVYKQSGLNVWVDSGTFTGTLTSISIRELPGNHAYQTTTTSRPVLSARVNLLTKTEQFDDAVWTKLNSTISANTTATTDPLGGTTADKLTENIASGAHGIYFGSFPSATTVVANVPYKLTCYVEASGRTKVRFYATGFGVPYPAFGVTADLVAKTITPFTVDAGVLSSSSITELENNWFIIQITGTINSTSMAWYVRLLNSAGSDGYTGDGTSGIYIWGASLVPANQASLPYQRVNTATDYDADPAKFPYYLRFDGSDDWLVTPTITPGVDRAQVFSGVRKLSDAMVQVFWEHGNNQPGGFTQGNYNDLGQNLDHYNFWSRGTANLGFAGSGGYPAPITNVLTGLGDISGDSAILRVNGTQVASDTDDQGTGNYGNYPLYIGRRAGMYYSFNGHIYGLIVRFGANLPIETIEQTEAWINSKTGAY